MVPALTSEVEALGSIPTGSIFYSKVNRKVSPEVRTQAFLFIKVTCFKVFSKFTFYVRWLFIFNTAPISHIANYKRFPFPISLISMAFDMARFFVGCIKRHRDK